MLHLALLPFLLGPPRAAAEERARLVVVLSVDQMPAELLERFAPMFEGGFARLLREGAVFASCAHDHAFTETGPGHAALLSGRHPGTVGIVENQWFDGARGELVYCVGDPSAKGVPSGAGFSPANLLGDGFGDWMKRSDPLSRVVSISGKDRAAVLMGGKKPDGAYWASEGGFTTSTYYRPELPAWLAAWNARRPWESYSGKVWEGRLADELLRRMRVGADDQAGERLLGTRLFPHRVPTLGATWAAAVLPFTPYFDALTLEVAREAISGEGLGEDSHPDLLCVGLSASDYVGHACGSGSRESAEQFRELDGMLGAFLAFLDEKAGKGRVLLALGSDHGVFDLPERLVEKGIAAKRYTYAGRDDLGVAEAKKRIAASLGPGEWIAYHDYRSIYLDRATCAAKGISPEKAAEEVAKAFRPLEWVAAAYTRADLLAAEPKDPFVPLFLHSFHRDRSGDVLLRHAENALLWPLPTGTSHGGPYLYDRAVPLLFAGPGIAPGRRAEPVHALDLAPTLAGALGVTIPEGVEGKSRFAEIRAAPSGGR